MTTSAEKRDGWSMLLRREWLGALAVLLGGILLHSMNVLMLATVLPTIVGELGGANLMSLPSTAFLASSIIAATCAGLGTATFGARNTYAVGATVFTAGAIVIALAPAMEWVIAGRFVQGFGGGLIAGVAYVLVRSTFPEAAWARVIALLSGMWSVAILVGPLAGGVFANRALARLVHHGLGHRRDPGARRLPRAAGGAREHPACGVPRPRLALVCAAIASSSSAAIVASPIAKALLIVPAVAILAAMLRIDRKAPTPLLPSDAFAVTTPAGLGLWLLLLVAVAYSPLQIFIPVFLQSLHDLDPLTAGYGVACASFGWTAASLIVAGAAEDGASAASCSAAHHGGVAGRRRPAGRHPRAAAVPAIVGIGAGIGSCWAFVAQRIMSGARKGEETVTAASVPTVQQMGFALGAALAASPPTRRLRRRPAARGDGLGGVRRAGVFRRLSQPSPASWRCGSMRWGRATPSGAS